VWEKAGGRQGGWERWWSGGRKEVKKREREGGREGGRERGWENGRNGVCVTE